MLPPVLCKSIYFLLSYFICLKMELNVYINWKRAAHGKLSLHDMAQKDAGMLPSGIPLSPFLVFFSLIFMYYWLSSSLRLVFMLSLLAMLICLLVHWHTGNDNYLDTNVGTLLFSEYFVSPGKRRLSLFNLLCRHY